ncbi:cytochrome P450 716A1-like [Pyrus communis]|uniref:cytochrome P450 716A1-like n=1 Tax=Pyrus communis TaxID=23211 RepID=UPI0035C21675
MATFEIFSKMLNPSREELLLFVKNYSDILIAALLSIVTVLLVPKIARGRVTSSKGSIPGGLGLPIFGETLSFLSTSNSAKGCYDFVRRRRMLYGDWFKTRLFGKIHVYVPSSEGARTIFASDFATFDKAYLKPMSDAVGVDSLLVVAQETHRRIRRLLSDPFSMSSLPTFIQKFDKILCQELKTREESGEKFSVLALSMKLTSDAMCTLLMSVTDDKILRMFEHDCALVSDAMISFPVMIPGTRYYNGMKLGVLT